MFVFKNIFMAQLLVLSVLPIRIQSRDICETSTEHSWSERYDIVRRTAGDRQPTTKLSNPIGCMSQAIYLPIFQHINGLQ